jgi:hypothetical protein
MALRTWYHPHHSHEMTSSVAGTSPWSFDWRQLATRANRRYPLHAHDLSGRPAATMPMMIPCVRPAKARAVTDHVVPDETLPLALLGPGVMYQNGAGVGVIHWHRMSPLSGGEPTVAAHMGAISFVPAGFLRSASVPLHDYCGTSRPRKSLISLVGAGRFELPTPSPPDWW